MEASGTTHYYHANLLGSVQAMVNSQGTVTDKYVYTPFGIEEPLNGSGNPFRYTGRRFDAESGLFHYRARYYDPVTGRFLETDPIGYEDQMNMYAYVGNDPLNATDPSGEFANFLIGAGIGLVVEGFVIAAEGGDPFDVKANAGRYGTAAAIGAVSSGVGAFASKAVATAAGKTTLKQVGAQGGGVVGKIAEGVVAGGVSGATAETMGQFSNGGISDGGAIANAAGIGAVTGGLAGGAQQSATNAYKSATGVRGPTPANLSTQDKRYGMSGPIGSGKEGLSFGALAGAAVNTASGATQGALEVQDTKDDFCNSYESKTAC